MQRERAFAAQAELARERGHVIARRRVMPAPLTLVVWRSIYETTDGRVVADGIRTPYLGPARVRRGDGVGLPVVRPGDPLPAAIPDDRREAARDARRVFAWFADGYVVQDPARPDRLLDARYGAATDPAAAFWGIEPAPPGTPLAAAPAGYHWWRAGARRDLARELWATIRGRDPHETALGGARSRSRPGEDADAGRGASGDADPAARRPTESLAAPGSSALAVAP